MERIVSDTQRRIEDKILTSPRLKIFSIYDFLNYGSYEATKKALLRLERRKLIIRILSGLYYKNSATEERPTIDDTAAAIAGKFNWTITPIGERCLEELGLRELPYEENTFLSSGPYRTYNVYDTSIHFKKTSRRDMENLSYKTRIIVQAIKTLGEENIREDDIRVIRESLTQEERVALKEECRFTSRWIYRIISKRISK